MKCYSFIFLDDGWGRRRTLLLSATFPDAVAESAAKWLKKPLCLRAKGDERDRPIDPPAGEWDGAEGDAEETMAEETPELGHGSNVAEYMPKFYYILPLGLRELPCSGGSWVKRRRPRASTPTTDR
eukprot:6870304-Pyramimonas_sp.AAC.1